MALTAAISLSSSNVPVSEPITARVLISNSGTSEVFMLNAVPHCFSTPEPSVQSPVSAQLGNPLIPPNSPVPAGGTLSLTFPAVFNAGSGLGTISIGCLLYGADGSVFDATTATITVIGNNQYA